MLMDCRIGIVILNYKNYGETIECLTNVLQQKNVDLEIVVVDNGSKNESVDCIEKWIKPYKNISLIASEENQGFSRGNNLGIKYLLDKGVNFIVISNSDIMFTDDNILHQIVNSYSKGIGVITPIIKNLDGKDEMRTQYDRKMFRLRVLKHLINIQKDFKKNVVPTSDTSSYHFLEPGVQENYNALTGCFFALTPDYLEKFPFLYPETFLYGEEIATLLLNDKAKLLTLIANTGIVIHKRAASTESDLKEGTYKKRKMMAESAKSIMKLLFMTNKQIRRKYSQND